MLPPEIEDPLCILCHPEILNNISIGMTVHIHCEKCTDKRRRMRRDMIPKEIEQKIIESMREINPELCNVYIEDILTWMRYFMGNKQLMWEIFIYHWEKDNQ